MCPWMLFVLHCRSRRAFSTVLRHAVATLELEPTACFPVVTQLVWHKPAVWQAFVSLEQTCTIWARLPHSRLELLHLASFASSGLTPQYMQLSIHAPS
eukprot:s2412_g7.t1